MKVGDRGIVLVDADAGWRIGLVRDLFRAYAAEFAASIAETLCFQGFEAELAGLPGRYAPPGGCLVLAMDGDNPAGCVGLRDLGVGTCEMKRLYVAPEYRGRGAGRLLVEEVIGRATRMGYRRMVLDTFPEMAGAIALYRSYGFVDAGRYWEHPAGEAVFLEKPLDATDAESGVPRRDFSG